MLCNSKILVSLIAVGVVIGLLMSPHEGCTEMTEQELRDYVKMRAKVIQQLLKVVEKEPKTPEENDRWAEAVDMLGALRAEEAAPLLVKHIAVVRLLVDEERTILTVYPAVGALIRIGYPSVRTIIYEGFRKERGEREQQLMAFVIQKVFGGSEFGKRVGWLVIEEHLRSAKLPPENRKRLQKFMETYFWKGKPTK